MKSQGSMLIYLISGVFFLVILTVFSLILLPRYTQLGTNELTNLEGSGKITDPINMAAAVATQADLKSIQSGLEAYFAENGAYPNTLEEASGGGYLNPNINLSNFSYQVCDPSGTKIVLYSTGSSAQGIVVEQGLVQNIQGRPSC